MNILDIIEKKRDNKKLTEEEIRYFVDTYTSGKTTDYQAAALIMAIYINGMDYEETKNLTLAMAESGKILDLSDISETIVDKHSSGGVGDKITIILMPIIAALGIPVSKMSGRGLGITGGTIDKLESIPGFRTDLSIEEFKQNIKEIGISINGQTQDLAPADKKMYALRDTIACTNSIPLIASSIMSKKIAAGANKLVLEVTCGNGAFMKDLEQAKKLSTVMKQIGKLANIETICVITNMNQPIGKNIGNSLEIEEAKEALKGNMEDDIREIILELGEYIIKLSGVCDDLTKNRQMIEEVITNGKAYNKFLELIEKQNGDKNYIEHIQKAKNIIEVKSDISGYVSKLDARKIGTLTVNLGAGRKKKEDKIDYTAGIVLNKKIGDKVEKGEILGYIHANKEVTDEIDELKKACEITSEKPEKYKEILDII